MDLLNLQHTMSSKNDTPQHEIIAKLIEQNAQLMSLLTGAQSPVQSTSAPAPKAKGGEDAVSSKVKQVEPPNPQGGATLVESSSDEEDTEVPSKPKSHMDAVLCSPEARLASFLNPSRPLDGLKGKSKSKPAACHSASSVAISPFTLSQKIDSSVDTSKIMTQIKSASHEVDVQSRELKRKNDSLSTFTDLSKKSKENKQQVKVALNQLRAEIEELEKKIKAKQEEIETHRKSLSPSSADLCESDSRKFNDIKGLSNPNTALLIDSAKKLINHLNASNEHLKGKGDTTNSPTVTVYPNEVSLPKGLKDSDVVRLKDVWTFLVLNQHCKSVEGYTLLFFVTSEKEKTNTGRQFVNLNRDVCPKGTFPTTSDFKRWILHFIGALEHLVTRYNRSNGTDISLNDALVSKKLNDVFSSNKSESFVRRRRNVKDMFADDSDNESQNSSSSVPFARGGGSAVLNDSGSDSDSEDVSSPKRNSHLKSRGGSACASGSTRVPSKQSGSAKEESIGELLETYRSSMLAFFKSKELSSANLGCKTVIPLEAFTAFQSIKSHPEYQKASKMSEFLVSQNVILLCANGNYTISTTAVKH